MINKDDLQKKCRVVDCGWLAITNLIRHRQEDMTYDVSGN